MVNESFMALACAGLIGMMFGLFLCFWGYRFFLFLLPIWGFVFGFGLGAQAIQTLFTSEGLLTTITGWVVGFVVGAIFAVLAYLFYFMAVAIIAGSLGYAIVVGFLQAIGMNMDWLVWLLGIAGAVILAIITLYFNIQKWVIIIATSILGAGVVFGTFVLLFNPKAQLVSNPIQTAWNMNNSWFIWLVFVVLAIVGIVVQFQSNRRWSVMEYNRWDEVAEGGPEEVVSGTSTGGTTPAAPTPVPPA